MKKYMKNKSILTLVFILSLMTSVFFLGSLVKAANLDATRLEDETGAFLGFSVEYTDIDGYYAKEIPTYTDSSNVKYLFAGWYENQDCTVSYVRQEGETLEKYFAKFVPQEVLSIKAQHETKLHNKVLNDTDEGKIRFVTSTDSANYQKVGMLVNVTIGGETKNYDIEVGTIYEKMYVVGTTDDKSDARTANQVFGTDASKYFAPHNFNMKFTQFGSDFTVTPYWITPDGMTVKGVTRIRSMLDNLEDYSYAEVDGRAYYSDDKYSALNEIFSTTVATFTGTEAEPTVITLLKEALTVTATVGASDNSEIVDTSVIIQNKPDMNVTVSRGGNYKGTMFDYFNSIQLGSSDKEDKGTLIVNAYSENAISGRTVNVRAGRTFVLKENATLQNANSSSSGAVIVNRGNCDLYGTIKDNQSSNAGNESGYAAGAILQCRQNGENELTIYSGAYTDNKNTGTYGGGGLIGTQATNEDEGAAGPITIEGGTFSNNSATYGGVVSSYTTNKVTISGGEFTSNGTQKNEADEVISACTQGGVVYLFKGATLDITGGEFNSNQADTYGGVISTLNQVGEINITGGKFTSNYAGTYGGVVSIARRGVLNISGGTFSENSAGSYGGVISTTQGNTTSNGATINITNGEFTANTGTPDGGVVYVNKSGELTISGGTFTGNSATTNGGVVSTAEGFRTDTDAETGTETTTALPITVTINGGTFTENSATTDGGVVFVNKYASLTVNSGTFEENIVTKYGGVISTVNGSASEEGPMVTINNGTFDSNSGNYGGVVFVDKCAILEIKGGTFSNNSAISTGNGGVIGTVTGTSEELRSVIKISDGEFSLNNAEQYGGVVHLGKYAKLTIDNGTFTSNTATDRGGVINATDASSTADSANISIANGAFTNNSAKIGGAIYLGNYGYLCATGGTYNENAATGYGAGAIYVCHSSADISNVTIQGNCTSVASEAYYGGGAITLHSNATVTLNNCNISDNTHAGAISDVEKNTNGCDIAFSGGSNNKRTQKLILQDESFEGVVGHVSSKVDATHQVQFSDGTIITIPAYNTRYTINYIEHTLEKVYAHRVILVSDMHYTTNETQSAYKSLYPNSNPSAVSGPMFGYSQDERIQSVFSDINAYIAKAGAIDSLMLLGDLSIDNYGYSNLDKSYLREFKTNYLTDLSYPWYALAGNHDSYIESDEDSATLDWKSIMGMKRQYSVVVGDAAFIMLDTFAAEEASSKTGSDYDGIDLAFLEKELEAYKDKKVFLCSHYYNPTEANFTDNNTAFVNLINQYSNVVCMFRGHSHKNAVYEKTSNNPSLLVDIGGYAYNPDGVDGDYNVFQKEYAWGYQVLEWDETEVHLYHVKPARTYTDSTETIDYEGEIENEIIIKDGVVTVIE